MPNLARRSFLAGLFVAPAIVAATNIMPVKAMDMLIRPDGQPFGMKAGTLDLIMTGSGGRSTSLITDIAEIQSASQLAHEWSLYDLGNGHRRWMTTYTASIFKHNGFKMKTMDVPQTGREIDTTVALMKADPGSAVIWGLPSDMMAYRRT